MPQTQGYTPYFILGSNIYFLAVFLMLQILSKCFNHSEKLCEMINYGPNVQRLGITSGTYYKRQDGVHKIKIEKTPTRMKKHPR